MVALGWPAPERPAPEGPAVAVSCCTLLYNIKTVNCFNDSRIFHFTCVTKRANDGLDDNGSCYALCSAISTT